MAKLDARAALTAPADGDLLLIQDISDLTDGGTGTSKKIAFDDLIPGVPTIFVAADDANASNKLLAGATYTCDGTADDVQINAAIDALPAGGGCVKLSSGTFIIDSSISISKLPLCLAISYRLRNFSIQSIFCGRISLP